MNGKPGRHPKHCRLLVAMLAAGASACALAQSYETQTSFKASEFASASLLSGPFHSVDPKVTVEGGLPRFTIRSKYGTWEARGREMLAVRVAEIPAFEKIEKVNTTAEFTAAAAKAATVPIQAVEQFIDNPTETAAKVASGIGTIFQRAGRAVTTTAERAADTATGSSAKKGPSILKPIREVQGTAQPRTFTGDPLGYNSARREWANRLNVDPYTSNAALAGKLDGLARATFAGSFPVDVTVGAVAGPVQYAVEANKTAQLQVYELPAIDVEKRNEARLAKMGITGDTAKYLFRNGYFAPTLQTALVLALESLGGASGRGEVVELAHRAASENEVRYVIAATAMLGKAGEPIASVHNAGNVLAGRTRGGKLVVAVPLDYIPWVPAVGDFARRTDLKGSERSLVVSGKVSPLAAKELSAAGWRVSANLVN